MGRHKKVRTVAIDYLVSGRVRRKEKEMKKLLNNILGALPFNGNKLNLGLLLGAVAHLAPQVVAFLPPGYSEIGSAALILIGALHKLVKG